jgi:putative transposase
MAQRKRNKKAGKAVPRDRSTDRQQLAAQHVLDQWNDGAFDRIEEAFTALTSARKTIRVGQLSTQLDQALDQGRTYASRGVQRCLRRAKKRGSMSRRANCWDNAVMESWFGTLKAELGDTFPDVRTADTQLFAYIEGFYNTRRMHSYLNYLAPAEFELAFHQRHQLRQ